MAEVKRVRLLAGREGTFEVGTELEVKETLGNPVRWYSVALGQVEWLIAADRVEVIERG